MTKLLQTVMIFAVAVAVLGLFSVYGNGRTVDLAFADGHDGGGGGDPGGGASQQSGGGSPPPPSWPLAKAKSTVRPLP